MTIPTKRKSTKYSRLTCLDCLHMWYGKMSAWLRGDKHNCPNCQSGNVCLRERKAG